MNNTLSQFAVQFQAIWKQLGLNQKISLVLATAVLLAGIGAVSMWSSRTDYSLLYGRLSDNEAARVISALEDAKVPFRTGGGGGSIYVPTEKVHVVRMQLAGRGIPRGDGVGFEIFDKPNFGISDFVQRANYVRAVQGELSRTISQLDEIEQARVMIVMPENRLFLDRDRQPTASVFVRVRGTTVLGAAAVNSIKFLVANSVEGLKPNFVTVVDNQGNVLSENTADDSLAGLSASQLTQRRNLEQYLARKVEGMLEKVVGPGQVIARVAADINLDTVTSVAERFDPDGQVVRSETKNDENIDSSQAGGAEAVGVSINTGSSTNGGAGALSSTRNQKITARVEYEISKTTSNIVKTAGELRRLTAAVTVAMRAEGAGAERKALPRTPEELEKLRKMVASALGAEPQRGDEVTLEEMPFNEDYSAEVTRQLQQDERWQQGWGLARQLGYPALALLVLAVLVRLLKRTPLDTIPIGVPLGHVGTKTGNGNGHGSPDRRKPGAGEVVTVEVLNQLVRENPNNMTHAIRNWLGRAGGTEGARNEPG